MTSAPGPSFRLTISRRLALLLGAAALFRAPLLLGPIAVLFGLIALIRGQYALGAIGTITGAAAILTSPWLWTGIGIAWLYEKLF